MTHVDTYKGVATLSQNQFSRQAQESRKFSTLKIAQYTVFIGYKVCYLR